MNFKLNIQLFGNAVIPYNEGRNGKRDIEGLWLQALATSKALTAAIGCEFGSVLNIQDAGQKEQGKVYLDKNNGKLYKCLNTTTSASNTTENFALFNVQQNSDRLDNLSESYYSDIDFQNGKIYFQKIGKLIMCTSMIQLTEPLNSGITNVGTVPEGFRPPKTVEIAVFGSAVERQADILGNIDIGSNGSMRLFSSQTFTSVAFRITACWFI